MSIAIIGGLDRLKRNYTDVAKNMGIKKIKVYNHKIVDLRQRINNLNGIIIFTGTICHSMVEPVVKVARNSNIPVVRSHTSSISGLKRCLLEIKEQHITTNDNSNLKKI